MKKLATLLLLSLVIASAADADVLKLRRDTSANWTKYNPILAQGEQGCEMTGAPLRCTAMKIGDGVTKWASLPYFSTGSGGGGGAGGTGAVSSVNGQTGAVTVATTAQGTKADTAVQPPALSSTLMGWASGAWTGISANGIGAASTSHHSTHATGGSDPLTADDIGLASRVKNIKDDFGAKGDGSDSTAAIQAALMDVHSKGGGVVYIPDGTFVVSPSSTAWLKVYDNTTIVGNGPSSIIKVKDNAGDYSTIFSGATLGGAMANVTFKNFKVDQNPAGNQSCDIRVGDTSKTQNVIYSAAANNVAVDGVLFDSATGINTVVLGGTNVSVRNNLFRFVKGRTLDASGEYDNSAVYLTAQGQDVRGNTFTAALSDHARGGVEVHGGPAVVTGNNSNGYETLCNIVTQSTETPILVNNDITVSGNTISSAGHGISLWSITGHTLANVTVADNTISINNADRAATGIASMLQTHTGIAFILDSTGTLDGGFNNISVRGNTISLQLESRSGYTYDDSGGILAYARGQISNISITGNTVVNAPTRGIYVRSVNGTADNVTVSGNTIIDAGNNTMATAGYRTSLGFYGTFITSRADNNQVVDTATGSAPNGYNGIYNYVTGVGPGSGAVGMTQHGNSVKQRSATGSLNNYGSSYVGLDNVASYDLGGNFTMHAMLYDRYEFKILSTTPALTLSIAHGVKRNQRMRVRILNSSGGAGPAIAWDSMFVMATPWVNPPDGQMCWLDFEFDGGTKYYEVSRSYSTPAITDSTSTASSTTAASATAVKAAYDLASGKPSLTNTAPNMDGAASAGSGSSAARVDHVHPTDTSRQETLVSGTNIKTVNGSSLLGSGDLVVGSNTYLTGSGLTTGSVYYMGASGLALAKADSATTLPAVCIATSATQCAYAGIYSGGTWTQGAKLYVSATTAGALTATAPSTAGQFVQAFGVAATASSVLALPSLDVGGL